MYMLYTFECRDFILQFHAFIVQKMQFYNTLKCHLRQPTHLPKCKSWKILRELVELWNCQKNVLIQVVSI